MLIPLVVLFSLGASSKPKTLVITREIPCGFEVIMGVDENRNGKLDYPIDGSAMKSYDERISNVVLCDKDQDFDINKAMDKTIIRTFVK